MKIKKIGHCCLVIDIRGNRIMTDPGEWSAGEESETNLCAVVITHEHADHFHIESLKGVLAKNPQAIVVTNAAVGKLLEAESIPYKKIEDGETHMVNGVLIEGYGLVHALIHDSIPPIQNTGYFFDNAFYYPGDAFYSPGKEVGVLALPVAGPWMKISEAVDFAVLVKPKKCIPVHDGGIHPERLGPIHALPARELAKAGCEFVALKEGEEVEL